jgi:hypothetical protein
MEPRLNMLSSDFAMKFAKQFNSAGALVTGSALPASTQELASQVQAQRGLARVHGVLGVHVEADGAAVDLPHRHHQRLQPLQRHHPADRRRLHPRPVGVTRPEPDPGPMDVPPLALLARRYWPR